uniref:3'-5' exonuclease n=1 Tax=Anthurium amnicola TaxID=1678845 RepID=A0A1D1YCD6_9ARAE
MSFGGRIVYCRTASEVEKATLELLDIIEAKKENMDKISMGFDLEWRPTFGRGEIPRKAAVMQICVDTAHCFVMHIIHSGIPSILTSLLGDSSYVKVGVSIANDALKILKDYGIRVAPLDDLSSFANLKLGGTHKKWSLCSLTEMLTCKQLAKPNKIRMGDWEVDALSREQLHYAATDAFASWYLYEVLRSFPCATAKLENRDCN